MSHNFLLIRSVEEYRQVYEMARWSGNNALGIASADRSADLPSAVSPIWNRPIAGHPRTPPSLDDGQNAILRYSAGQRSRNRMAEQEFRRTSSAQLLRRIQAATKKSPRASRMLTDTDRLQICVTPSPEEWARHAPDAHWILFDEFGAIGAQCSLWWRQPLPHSNHRVGVVGHYAASDELSGRCILRHACAELRWHGCTLAAGPMDGNTWRKYRCITERGCEPPFFLEPDHPDDWPQHFVGEGFTTFATYSSALNGNLEYDDPRAKEVEHRLNTFGVRVRSLRLDDFENELRRIYSVTAASFRNGLLYTSIPADEFLAQFRPIQSLLRPELILLANYGDRTVGYLFAIPDWLQVRREARINTAIIKTLAVLPDRRFAGLGAVLVARMQNIARDLGFARVIHALMHDGNRSRSISARYAKPMRRYTLFAKTLS